MKTYLFYFHTSFNLKFMGAMLDEAISLLKENNDVFFAYCGGVCEMCTFNQRGRKRVCKLCSYCTKTILEKHGIKAVNLQDYYKEQTETHFDYNNADDYRSIIYRNVNVGLGITSSFISLTRNMSPLMNNEAKKFFDAHLNQNIRMVDAFYNLVNELTPDYLYAYNGRYEDSRFVFDISQALNIPVRLIEDVKVDGVSHILKYEDHLPHDIGYYLKLRDYCWDHYNLDEKGKIELGEKFYNLRRNGKPSGDVKIYIKDQKEGYVPDFDNKKINIAIMNSSEDEYAAVGGEWDKLKFFKTQYEGIIFLLENAPSNVHFYLRIHPNLKDIKYKYHTDLLKLEDKYSNITVIPGNSTMSTYTIMEKTDKIISFGSTMGIECVFWGKPSILLGPARYYYDGLTYNPKTREELIDMLKADLKPLVNDNLYKFGAYTIDLSPLYINLRNIDNTLCYKKVFGVSFTTSPYFKLWLSSYFTSLITGFVRFCLDRKPFWKYVVPLKEQ